MAVHGQSACCRCCDEQPEGAAQGQSCSSSAGVRGSKLTLPLSLRTHVPDTLTLSDAAQGSPWLRAQTVPAQETPVPEPSGAPPTWSICTAPALLTPEQQTNASTPSRSLRSRLNHLRTRAGSNTMLVHLGAEESIGRWRPTGMQILSERQRLTLTTAVSHLAVNFNISAVARPKLLGLGLPSQGEEEGVTRKGSTWSHDTLRKTRSLLVNEDQLEWICTRIGTGERAALFLGFTVLSSVRFVTQEYAYNRDVNPFACLLLANLLSLLFALVLSFGSEGRQALPKMFCWHAFWRFLGMAFLFTSATFLTIRAYRTGLLEVTVVLLGYMFMPISVCLSYMVFRREYGKLEWLATGMMVLATVAFVLVRERCHLNECHMLVQWTSRDMNAPGIVLVLCSVLLSVVASLLSERLYKDMSRGLIRSCKCQAKHDHSDSIYVMKVHLDFSSTLFCMLLWGISVSPFGAIVSGEIAPDRWLGDFTLGHAVLVLVIASHSWLAALVTKRFDTVLRSLVETLSTVLAVCVVDPLAHDKWHFSSRWLASVSMAGIVVVSALVFQTGRINLKAIRSSLNLPAQQSTIDGGFGWWDSVKSMIHLPCCSKDVEEERSPSEGQCSPQTTIAGRFLSILKYSSIFLYVLADGLRTVLQSAALSNSQNTPAVFVLVINACGLILANSLTLWYNGSSGMRQAWNPRKVLRFLLCGFFFALTSTLQALAYALGISPAMSMVIGKFYTPMMALLSRWILGKFFLALEWFAIAILTLANIAYGSVNIMESAVGDGSGESALSALLPALCVLGSAFSACVNSLVMERLMTGEEKLLSGGRIPFHMQKVRLDVGTVISALAFLPAFGLIATGPGSEKYAFWKDRPLSAECSYLGTCEHGTFKATDAASTADLSSCTCGGGFFVGWDTPSIYAALLVNIFYSWITGIVVLQFSSIYRAIADAFSLALVYFVLQPLIMGGGWADTGLDLLAVLIPISAVTFSFSANEMQMVMKLAKGTDSIVKDANGQGTDCSQGTPNLFTDRESTEDIDTSTGNTNTDRSGETWDLEAQEQGTEPQAQAPPEDTSTLPGSSVQCHGPAAEGRRIIMSL